MKIRQGFVSNSSSSSFICDMCGYNVEGRDLSVEDADFYYCENGHEICGDCMNAPVDKPDDWSVWNEENDGISEKYCPLCNFEELDFADARRYLLKTTKYTEEEVLDWVKSVNKRRKKLRDEEYVEYVCRQLGITTTELLKQLDDKFGHSYKKLLDFLKH